MSDWRGSSEGLSQHRTSLYSAPYKKINPSVSGIQEEVLEVTRWANQYLSVGGYSDHLITDLTSDLSDGITLLRLVQAVSEEDLPRHFTNPMMRVQKLENLQVCLNFLKQQGLQQLGVHPEEIASGNVKAILAVCQALRRHYTAGPSPQVNRGSRGRRAFSFSSLEKEDVAILSWVGEKVHRDIPDYTVLYDGCILCELVNELKDEAIPLQEIHSSSSVQRLRRALSASETHFFIPHSHVDVNKMASGSQDTHIRSYLQQLQTVDLQKVRKSVAHPPTSTRTSRPRSHSREEVFESLRTSSVSHQSREEAKIASRTFEGLRRKKTAQEENPSTKTDPPVKSKRPKSEIPASAVSGSYSDLSRNVSDRPSRLTKHSSSEALQQQPHSAVFAGGHLDRHRSMDTVIAQPSLGVSWPRPSNTTHSSTLSRSISQTIPPHPQPSQLSRKSRTSSIDGVNMPTFDLRGRRTPSYSRLESSSVDDLSSQVTGLEERVATLTAQFLYERQDMYKQMDRALIRERKRRQLVERRLRDIEAMSRALMKHYDSRLIEMAKQVSLLRGELMARGPGNPPSSVTMEIQQLKDTMNQIIDRQGHVTRHVTPSKSVPPTSRGGRQRAQTLFVRKHTQNEISTRPSPSGGRHNTRHGNKPHPPSNQHDPSHVYARGSLTSFKKLSKFFGEDPPRLEDMQSFLEALGYADLIQLFHSQDVSLAELSVMEDKDLDKLGVPLGPRIRILQELKKLRPVDNSDII